VAMKKVRLDVISKISPCHRRLWRKFSTTDKMFPLLPGIRWLGLVQVPLAEINCIYAIREKNISQDL